MNANELRLQEKMIDNAYTMRREIIEKMTDETRDIDLECGYPTTLKIADYEIVFGRNGIGTRVVMLWPEECWNTTPDITEGEDTEETAFEKAWKDLEKKFRVLDYLFRADVLSGVGRYGALLIGVSDGLTLDMPVVAGKKLELTYLKPLCEGVLDIEALEPDVKSPRFGQPTFYTIKTDTIDGELNTQTIKIHYSRVIHLADNRKVSDVFGTPRLEPVFNYILDLKKLLGGSAEMFWKGGFPGYAFEVNPERTTALTTTEKTELREEFLNFSNKLQRYIALTGVTAKSLAMQVADPSNHFLTQMKAVGIALGIPYRKLMGSEEAKLASADDNKTWTRRVVKRQVSYVTPRIIRPFIDKLIEWGILPEPKDGYEVKWPSLDELDPKDAAIVMKDKVEAMAKYIVSGADSLIPPHQFFTLIMGWTDEEATEIEKAAVIWLKDHPPEEEPDPNAPDPDEDEDNDI